MLRKGGGVSHPIGHVETTKTPIARNRGTIAEIVSRHRAIQATKVGFQVGAHQKQALSEFRVTMRPKMITQIIRKRFFGVTDVCVIEN